MREIKFFIVFMSKRSFAQLSDILPRQKSLALADFTDVHRICVICEIFAQKNYRTYKSATQRTHNK